MEISFTGNKPQKKTYSYSVKENNNSNIITFILNKEIEGLNLSALSCFVKVEGSEIDKDVPSVEVEEDQIKVHWTLLRKHTISHVLKVQLQFEGSEDIVWQTEILTLVLSETIKADEYIENKYPAVLVKHEEELIDHKQRIETLEEEGGTPIGSVELYFEKNDLSISIKDKQGQTIASDDTTIPLSDYATKEELGGVQEDVSNIKKVIPAQATEENKLADKNFVNSSIATNTATFRGTYNIITDLGLTLEATHEQIASAIATKLASLSIVPTNNDYVFIAYPDPNVPTQFTAFDRYKYNGDNEVWSWEYELNNSSFTANQWASINSGITAQMVADMPQKSQNETITGEWSFSNNIKAKIIKDLGGTGFEFFINDILRYVLNSSYFSPANDNARSIGSSGVKWKEGFINKITDTNGSYSSDNVLNIINVADMTDSLHFTQDQLAIIGNGKPTKIIGSLNSQLSNVLITSVYSDTTSLYCLLSYANNSSNQGFTYITITKSNGFVILRNNFIRFGTNSIYLNTDNGGHNTIYINGKQLPDYPSNTGIFGFKMDNGTLVWSEEITFNFNTNFSNAQTNAWTEITDSDDLALLANFRNLTKIPTKVSFSTGYQIKAIVLYHNVYQNQGTNFSFFLGNEGNKLTIQYQNDKWQYIKR